MQKLGSFLAFSVLALFVVGVSSAIWGALIYANMRLGRVVPWCVLALAAFLWSLWQYLGGRGWPRTTSTRRRLLLRANPVSRAAFSWSFLAGLLAILSLAGLWIVLFRLIPMRANAILPGRFSSSPLFTIALIIGASLLAPIVEESTVRGYLQCTLERDFSPLTAVTLSSAVFAVAHVTQGLAPPKLLFYFLVGIAFGSLAWLNNSILPVIPVHIVGDLTFFFLIWPNDHGRSVIWQQGPDKWFWLHVAQMMGFAVASILAFREIRASTAIPLEPRARRDPKVAGRQGPDVECAPGERKPQSGVSANPGSAVQSGS